MSSETNLNVDSQARSNQFILNSFFFCSEPSARAVICLLRQLTVQTTMDARIILQGVEN